VKLIDVYPESAQKNSWEADGGPKPGQYAQSLNGYELPIAMKCGADAICRVMRLRTRSRKSTIEWNIPLRDHDHVFLKGHRIMVQIHHNLVPAN